MMTDTESKSLPERAASRTFRIIIADDHAAGRRAHAETMRAFGFDVAVASTAVEVLRLVASGPTALIVAGFHLPDLDGVELSLLLKANPQTRGIPVILLAPSAVTGTDAVPDGTCELVIARPVSPLDLAMAIKHLLPRRNPLRFLPSFGGEA